MNKRALCFICSIVIALTAVAAPLAALAADGDMYLYNGVELPALPDWDPVERPYAYVFLTSDGDYCAFHRTSPYHCDASGYIIVYGAKYKLEDGVWVKNTLLTGIGGTIVWCYSDLYVRDTDNLYMEGTAPTSVSSGTPIVPSEPLDPTDPSESTEPSEPETEPEPPDLKFYIDASWNLGSMQYYYLGDTPEPYQVVVTDGNPDATYSYQWVKASSDAGPYVDIPGATSNVFYPPVTEDNVGRRFYGCRVTAQVDEYSLTLNSILATVYVLSDVDMDDAAAGEQFGSDVDQKVDEFENAVGSLDQVEKPDISDIDLSVDAVLGNGGAELLEGFYQLLVDVPIIAWQITVTFSLILVSYLLFGKKG